MAKEGWTKRQILILIIIALIAFAVGFIPNVVKNSYKNNKNFIGALSEGAAGGGLGTPDEDTWPTPSKDCAKSSSCELCCIGKKNQCEGVDCYAIACKTECSNQKTTEDKAKCWKCFLGCQKDLCPKVEEDCYKKYC